jgi:isopentenyl diphosphate isomerase/L-lactate dehydrogenase-like FMN-dependent dehydrogenase
VAKALAIGADAAAAGLPFLEAATQSVEAVSERLDFFITGLRIATFASGCRGIADLRGALYVRGSDDTLIADPAT